MVIERPDLVGSQYASFKSAVEHVDEFVPMMEKEFAKRPIDEWCERLQRAGIPHEKLAVPADVLVDEQCWANNYLLKHRYDSGNEGIIFNTPVMFTENGRDNYVPAPRLGQHTQELLKEAGYDESALEQLRQGKVIK